MTPQDLVCARCWRDFFDTEAFEQCCVHDSDGRVEANTSVREIRDANCTLCSYIRSFIPDEWAPGNRVTVSLSNTSIKSCTPRGGTNIFYLSISCDSLEGKWIGGYALFLHAWTVPGDGASGYVTARPLQTEVDSEASKAQLKAWWQECSAHDGCKALHQDSILPTRVIEVSPLGQQHPRVINSGHLHGIYATLSYCWGKEAFLTLTQSNKDKLMEELDPLTLPPTFSHAISTARSLSIPYLWIDALCIIQDSEDDKTTEIASMKRIYSSSTLTITAASASGVFEGVLHPRTDTEVSYTIPFRIRPGKFGTVSVNELDAACYDERLEPIAKRAWSMQEQLLARRSLVFTSRTMMWRCSVGIRNLGDSLYFPHDLDSGYNDYDEKYSLNLHSLLPNEEESFGQKDKALSCWMRLVTAYSLRTASLEHDKLNAIAGIAAHPSFSRSLGPRYFAGLWQHNLARQLAWRTSHRHRTLPEDGSTAYRPENYRAPSWSWASIEGGVVQFDFILDDDDSDVPEPICDVSDVSTTLKFAELNPFGEVTSGLLRMKTVCRNAWFNPSTSNVFLLPASTSANVDKDTHDNDIRSLDEATEMHVRDFKMRHPDIDLCEEPEATHGTDGRNMCGICDETDNHDPVMVMCAAIARVQGRDNEVEGLILVPSEVQGGTNVFRRIGFFERGRDEGFSSEIKAEIAIV